MQLFLILLLLSHVTTVTAVAGCHSDRDKDHRQRENCTAAGFSDVPAGFKPSTKVLLFPNNLFSSLSWFSFQTFSEIYEIDLTGNKVPEVTSSASPMLPSLSVLRLGSNRLTSLPDGSFSACPGLTELYLDNNSLESLSGHTFSGLIKLEILELSANRIKVLPELLLHPLPAIETLYLENNKIQVMPDNWFSRKEEVPYLYLSANPWACFCSLGYLRQYIDDYEQNIYVRDGPIIRSDVESVVCDSPQGHKGKPVMSLDIHDLCPPARESGPSGDNFYQPVLYTTAMLEATTITTSPLPTSVVVAATSSPTSTTPTSTAPTSTTPTSTAPTPSTTASTSPATPAFVEDLHSEYHRVVTRSWYHTFTGFIEWSDHSGSEVRGEMPLVVSRTSTTHPTLRPSTESPATMATATPEQPVRTTTPVPVTVASTTPRRPVASTTSSASWRRQTSAVGGAGLFCFWLFAGCMLLCATSAACTVATLARLVVWYRRVYKPLSVSLARRGGGSEGVRLVTYSRREEKEVAGVVALYRSVLIIHREAAETMRKEDGGRKERVLVTLEPTEGGATKEEGGGETEGREERGVYRKTLYRLLSKEEEIEGWRDVMEECRVSAEEVGRRGGGGEGGGGGGGESRKRYSVILREERVEAGAGGEEVDWVVGGWEVKRGGQEDQRSSWGEWLAHYLPSMPWGVTTSPEDGAAL